MRHIDRYVRRQTMRFHWMVYWVMYKGFHFMMRMRIVVGLVMEKWGMGWLMRHIEWYFHSAGRQTMRFHWMVYWVMWSMVG